MGKNPKVLFILKRHEGSGGPLHSSSGLRNSAHFVSDALNREGIARSSVVIVEDANRIDREVYVNRPDVVILEAIWCPPAKLRKLVQLHPEVQWAIRIHSEIPFLAGEGIALSWLHEYTEIRNTVVSTNSARASRDLAYLDPVLLPNYYPYEECEDVERDTSDLKIGCFGAIRPMKNQLAQAFAAIEFAKSIDVRSLTFYVNGSRTEQGGENVIKNMRALFDAMPAGYKLVEAKWADHKDFLKLVALMHVCLNVSMSETFCITAADAAGQKIPIVTSPEVSWSDRKIQADPTDIPDIVQKIHHALGWERRWLVNANHDGLKHYNRDSLVRWSRFLVE